METRSTAREINRQIALNVVRELAPRSPERKVVAATTARPGVAPAARTMIRVLSDVARRYTDAHLSVVSPAAAAS